MRQEQREARRLPPLCEPGDDELVDDHLAAVREVAVLRLPQHQRLGRRGGIAVLESETGELGERAVVQVERRAGAGEVLNRRVALPGHRVVQLQMPLAERATHRVLAGEPDRGTLAEQRGERERLRVRPIDVALGERGPPPLELPLELGIHGESRRDLQQLLVQARDERRSHRGVGLGHRRLRPRDPLRLFAGSPPPPPPPPRSTPLPPPPSTIPFPSLPFAKKNKQITPQ